MIVGIAALFSIVFFGGSQEYFLIEDLDKGIKKHITEKERSKELTADLKLTKSMIKAFNKKRESQLKELHSMNSDRNVTKDAMQKFYQERHVERLEFQEAMLTQRLLVTSKINDEEWQQIIDLSQTTLTKKNLKADKKGSKDPYQSIIESIEANIEDEMKRQQALKIFADFKINYTNFLIEVNKVNSLESEILSTRTSSAADFKALSIRMNQLRENAFQSLIDLHFEMKDVTTDVEWAKVIKSINKVFI